MFHRQGRKGLTLIELLVVLAILAILVSLLLPAVQKVREAAARTQCGNNLKQIGLGLHGFHDTYQHFPTGFYPWYNGMFTYTGWQLQLLPFLEQTNLWNESYSYLRTNPASTDSNAFPAAGFQLKIFICPSNARPTIGTFGGVNYELTSYLGNAGTSSNNPVSGDGILYSLSQVRFTDVADGTSNTIAVGERPATGDLYWGWGFSPYGTGAGDGETVLGAQDKALAVTLRDVATNVGLQPPRQPSGSAELDGAHFWSFHTGGVNFLFCDGSIRLLPYSANNVFPQLCTRAGGEVFSLP